MRAFSTVLEEYLEERDRQNSNYYENRYIGSRIAGRDQMTKLANEMNEIIAVRQYVPACAG